MTAKRTSQPKGMLAIAGEIAYNLRKIDERIYSDGTKERLVVNQPKRKIPHYPFVPSFCDPEPWGIEKYNERKVHKRSGKAKNTRSKR